MGNSSLRQRDLRRNDHFRKQYHLCSRRQGSAVGSLLQRSVETGVLILKTFFMIKKLLSVVASLLLLITLVISCQKDALRNDHLDDNKPPFANAGRDAVVVLPQDSFLLDGTASYDPDGTIDKYSWSKISGPSASAADP